MRNQPNLARAVGLVIISYAHAHNQMVMHSSQTDTAGKLALLSRTRACERLTQQLFLSVATMFTSAYAFLYVHLRTDHQIVFGTQSKCFRDWHYMLSV